MGEATREFAIAKTMEILRAYVRKIEDAKGYLDCLSPEGRRIVEDYGNNADGQRTLLLKASESEDFFSGMPDEAVLAYADVCRKINERFELNVKKVYPIERLAADKKGFWGTFWGALQGEFNEDQTGSEILIDMGLNFIPFVGQACDARDIAACLKKLVIEKRANEAAIWVTLLLTAIGCVPYAGDVVKAGCKAILKGADDIFLTVLKKIDAEDAYRAFVKFRSKFASGIDKAVEMVCRWIEEARKSKYGSKVDSVLASAGENLRKAVEFMKERIDEFGERVFKKGKREAIKFMNIPKSNGFWSGMAGNSKWIPDDDFIPLNPKTNPNNLSWKQIKSKYGINEIPFHNGEPDFTKVSKGKVVISNFTEIRRANFMQADIELAKKKKCSWQDVQKWREKNKYTWHECSDCKTLMKVPTVLHGNVVHTGGISAKINVN